MRLRGRVADGGTGAAEVRPGPPAGSPERLIRYQAPPASAQHHGQRHQAAEPAPPA